jgi:signal transduction histidine kinase/ActR/RegA family two-component response regulator
MHFQSKAMEQTLRNNGKILANILAYNAKIGVFSENIDLLKNPVDGIFQQEEVFMVTVYNKAGKVLINNKKSNYNKHNKTINIYDNISDQLFKNIKAYNTAFFSDHKDSAGFWSKVVSVETSANDESLFFDQEMPLNNVRTIGFVRVLLSKHILHDRLLSLCIRSIYIALFFWLAGSIVGFFVIKSIIKPLNQLTSGVKAFGEHGVIDKIPVDRKDEIGKLADAFNNMYESLKKRDSEKKQLEEQLLHSQKMEAIGTLAGGIAHDFNNILGVIVGYTELALLDIPETDPLRGKLDQVLKASGRATDLVKQILAFSRKDKQKLAPIRIDPIVKEAIKMLRSSLPTTIAIRTDIKKINSSILSDPSQIHQILMNLCTNASHAMPDKKGVLEVSLDEVDIDQDKASKHADLQTGRYQRLTVRDNGEGIKPEIMDRIFDPFFTTKGPGKGTGMGLAVVHGIVKRCKGAIIFDSKPGKGTTFQIFFPIVDSNTPEQLEIHKNIPDGNEKILYIDDEKQIINLGREILEELGYKVVAKTTATDAIEVFRAAPDSFDVVITDMTMPEMTGIELAGQISIIRPGIPIILCSGYHANITKEKVREAGIREIIMKPFAINEIACAIRDVLENNKKHDA